MSFYKYVKSVSNTVPSYVSIDKDVDGLVVVVKLIRRLPVDFGTTEINLVFELYMGWDFI